MFEGGISNPELASKALSEAAVRLRDQLSLPALTEEDKATSSDKKSNGDDTASKRADLGECARRLITLAKRAAQIVEAAEPNSVAAAKAVIDLDAAKKSYSEIAHTLAFSNPEFSFFLGPNFSLNKSGGWETGGGEALLRFDAGPESFFKGYGRSYTEISYQKIGAINDETTDEEAQASIKDPFASKQGFFRIDSGVILPARRHGLLVSAGLTSIDSDDNAHTRLEPRLVVGYKSATFFTQGTYSQFTLGYAYDQFWQYRESAGTDDAGNAITRSREDFDRAVVDGTLYLPQLGTGQLQAALRLYVDTPLSGHGPSSVRVSVLAYFDLNGFLAGLNPLIPGAAP